MANQKFNRKIDDWLMEFDMQVLIYFAVGESEKVMPAFDAWSRRTCRELVKLDKISGERLRAITDVGRFNGGSARITRADFMQAYGTRIRRLFTRVKAAEPEPHD